MKKHSHPLAPRAASSHPPHPATLQAKALPPHPATVVQRRAPHPATIAPQRARLAERVRAAPPALPAIQRSTRTPPPAVTPKTVQRFDDWSVPPLDFDEPVPIYKAPKVKNLNEVVAPRIQEGLRGFYSSMPVYNQSAPFSYYAYGLNPLAVPSSVVKSWDQLDPSLAHLRSVSRITRTLSDYTDVAPSAIVSEEQLSNANTNLSMLGYGLAKRLAIQSVAIRMLIGNPWARRWLMLGNIGLQFGGNLLLKDLQIRDAVHKNGLTIEQIDDADVVLRHPQVKEHFQK